jgi:AcrR family transcriptional regulator
MTADSRLQSILDATGRLLGRGGTEAVTMRAVAEEAGVSLRLVQYYGRSKDHLLGATLDQLSARSLATWRDASRDGGPTDVLASYLTASLPLTEETRALHRVGVSMELMAVTGAEPGASAYRRHLDAVAAELAEAWQAPTSGTDVSDDAANADDHTALQTAHTVMALGHGLGSLVMAGSVSEDEAKASAAAVLRLL